MFKVFAKIVFLLCPCIFGQKNIPKTFPKRRPNPSKTDAQNMLLINIHFFTFRLPFRRLLGLPVGAETLTKRKATVRKTLLDAICEHLLLLNSIFHRFGRVWEGLWQGFGRVGEGLGKFCEGFKRFWEGWGEFGEVLEGVSSMRCLSSFDMARRNARKRLNQKL